VNRRETLQVLVAFSVGAPLMGLAQSYPARAIRLILPLPAGSSTDVVARAFAASVAASVNQPIVVENKPGADGLISGNEVRRSSPDGYTLFFATNSPMMVAPAMKKSPPYDPTRDFTPIIQIGRYTFLFVVHPAVPAQSLEEFIGYVKMNPAKVAYATGNTTGIVACQEFANLTGTKMVHVPFKGEPQAMVDLLAGRVQLMLATAAAAIPQIREGKLRPLAAGLDRRIPDLPDVPTLAESGLPQLSIGGWAALYGPPGLPRDIVDRMNAEFLAAASRPEVRATMMRQLFVFTGSSPDDLAKFTRDQYEGFKGKMKTIGLEAD